MIHSSVLPQVLIFVIFVILLLYAGILNAISVILPVEESKKVPLFELTRRLWVRLTDDKVFLSWFVLIVAAVIIAVIYSVVKKHLSNGEIVDGLLIELGGMFFDILILVLFTNWVTTIGEKSQRIRQLEEEIDDFRVWQGDEPKYRILGNVRRLQKIGITRVDLNSCKLEDGSLMEMDLSKSSFKSAILTRTCFEGSVLVETDFSDAILDHTDLRSSNLNKSVFKNAVFIGTDFKNAQLNGADFTGADFHGVKNLTINQLSTIASLKGVKGLSDGVVTELKERGYNRLF